MQSASDHVHSLTIPASTVDATTAQTFNTGVAEAHMHMVTLSPTDLSALATGGSVTVVSSVTDLHAHMFAVSCH
jgi:hypothetical protein